MNLALVETYENKQLEYKGLFKGFNLFTMLQIVRFLLTLFR